MDHHSTSAPVLYCVSVIASSAPLFTCAGTSRARAPVSVPTPDGAQAACAAVREQPVHAPARGLLRRPQPGGEGEGSLFFVSAIDTLAPVLYMDCLHRFVLWLGGMLLLLSKYRMLQT